MTQTTDSPIQLTRGTQIFIDELESQEAPPIYTLEPEAARQVLIDIQSKLEHKIPVAWEDHTFCVGPTGKIDVRIVRPPDVKNKIPFVFYIHGGGWILGNHETHDRLIREIATIAHVAVVFPSYTPSPEAKFPIPLQELYAALEYVIEHAEELKLDAKKIIVAGDSVGGNMATALTLMAKKHPKLNIDYQLLFYPVTDANFETDSYHQFAEGPWLTREAMKWFWNAYAPGEEPRQDILASPLRAASEELEGLPPACIITAENDVLRDEGEAYARKLLAAGVRTLAVRYQGTIHDFVMLNDLAATTPTRAAIAQVCAAIRDVLTKQ